MIKKLHFQKEEKNIYRTYSNVCSRFWMGVNFHLRKDQLDVMSQNGKWPSQVQCKIINMNPNASSVTEELEKLYSYDKLESILKLTTKVCCPYLHLTTNFLNYVNKANCWYCFRVPGLYRFTAYRQVVHWAYCILVKQIRKPWPVRVVSAKEDFTKGFELIWMPIYSE